MQKVRLNLKISPEEYLKLYQGSATVVTATAIDGRSVRFPAKILKPYITRRGILGVFDIYFDEKGKFQKIEQLS